MLTCSLDSATFCQPASDDFHVHSHLPLQMAVLLTKTHANTFSTEVVCVPGASFQIIITIIEDVSSFKTCVISHQHLRHSSKMLSDAIYLQRKFSVH